MLVSSRISIGAARALRALFGSAVFAGPLALAMLLPSAQALAQCATSGTDQTCTNSVALTGGASGISDNNNLTVTNTSSGNIFGTTYGIFTFNNATVTNSGIISGGAQYGIFANNDATIINSGSISASSAGVSGVYVFNNATIINSGVISGPRGIIAAGGGIFNLFNSGTIIGTSGSAIDFSSSFTGNTLNLLPGSRIIGNIDLGAGDTVNVRSGRDIAWLLTFGACGCGGLVNTGSTANVTGGAPFVIKGDQIATLDPTTFGMTDRSLVNFTGNISSLVGDRFGEPGSRPGVASSSTAFAPTTSSVASTATTAFDGISSIASAYRSGERGPGMLPNTAMVDHASGTAAWSKGFVGASRQDGNDVTLRATSIAYGGAIGMDGQVAPDLRLGGFIGAGYGRMDVDLSSQTIGTDYVFGGLYGRHDEVSRFFDFAVSAGHSSNHSTRTVANNLLPNGLETATASYGGWFVSPELAYGVRIPLEGAMMLTPIARLRYIAGIFDGYSETGSAQNLTVASRTLQNIEERFELALSRTNNMSQQGFLKTTVTLGVLGMQRLGDTTVNTTLIGQNLSFAAAGKDAVAGIYTGIGFDYRTSDRVTLFASAEGTRMSDDSISGTAKGGVRVAF